jgi:hypothetical protein
MAEQMIPISDVPDRVEARTGWKPSIHTIRDWAGDGKITARKIGGRIFRGCEEPRRPIPRKGRKRPMKFRPEADNDRNEGIPSAEPGEYTMRISAWIEDRQTKNGTKDLVEFVGETEGTFVGSTMWISHPENGKKGNLWKYRQLAEALGDDALEQYRAKDKGGFSMFNPIDWKDRAVIVEVGQYGIEEVRRLDTPAEPNAGVATADRGKLGQVRRRDLR